MKSTFRILRVNSQRELMLAIDVSKARLEYRSDVPVQDDGQGRRSVESLEGSIARRSGPMRDLFSAIQQRALEAGYEHVLVACEPTGGYEHSVLRMARQMGCLTCYVSGESVNKAKVIDHNDRGKTDVLDTGVMLTVGGLGKILKHRPLSEVYGQLRILNRQYEAEDRQYVATKCELHHAIHQLFCDFSRQSSSFYTAGGRAVMEVYQYNPYRIVRAGQKRFYKAVRHRAPRTRQKALQQLWADAVSSSRQQVSLEECALWQERVQHHWTEYLLHEKRRSELRAQMEGLYQQLVEQQEAVPMPHKRFLGAFRLARIVAETGPLTDFPCPAAILKYAGLNLCDRQSGKSRGQVKLSHKGNAHLRDAMGEAAYLLVRKAACYGPYYHHKKDAEGKKATEALTAVMRKLLGVVWTLGVKRRVFDERRLVQSESHYHRAA